MTGRPSRTSIGAPGASPTVEAPERPFGGSTFIADKSAWARSDVEYVRGDWTQALRNGQICTCPITCLELLYSTRTSHEFEELEAELATLREVSITRSIVEAARAGYRELAAHSDGYHRLALPDLLIAACAQDAGIGVLHYDREYDRLREVLNFESRWVAPAGTLD